MVSIEEIKTRTQSGKRDKTHKLMWGYVVHRNISVYVTWFLLRYFPSVKPQQVSFLMIVISVVGALCIFFGGVVNTIFGFLFVYIGFLLDKVDGEIARYTEIYNVQGVFLDEMYHVIAPATLFFSFFYQTVTQQYLLFPFVILIVGTVFSRYIRKSPYFIEVKVEKLIDANKLILKQESKKNSFSLLKFTSILERFDIVLLLLFFAYIVDTYITGAVLYALYFFSTLVLLQAFRYFYMMYFGGAEQEISRVRNEGY